MLLNKINVVEAIAPQAGGAITGDYISLKNVLKAWVVVHITQAASNTVAITIEQDTITTISASKAITKAVPIWSNLDCAASDVLVARTAAVSYTTDAGIKHKIVIFEIDPATLDIANGFDCITVKTGSSDVSNITSAQYILEQRYSGAVEITD